MAERPVSGYEASLVHPGDADWGLSGWRTFFTYRDLGVRASTGGDYDFRVAKSTGGEPVPTGWHYHVLDLQVTYCLEGWEVIALEDGRIAKLTPGTCLNIPPGLLHNEIGYAPDMQMLVLTRPAEVTTVAVDPPAGWDDAAIAAQVAEETTPELLSRPWSWRQPVANPGRV